MLTPPAYGVGSGRAARLIGQNRNSPAITTAVTVVVNSIAAPRTSPLTPPNRRTQCRTSSAAQVSETTTATGPCHGCRPAADDAASSTTTQAATTGAGWVPTTRAPNRLAGAAGKVRRQASTAATRPAHTATTIPAAHSPENASP